jgi:hypothetical protein
MHGPLNVKIIKEYRNYTVCYTCAIAPETGWIYREVGLLHRMPSLLAQWVADGCATEELHAEH